MHTKKMYKIEHKLTIKSAPSSLKDSTDRLFGEMTSIVIFASLDAKEDNPLLLIFDGKS